MQPNEAPVYSVWFLATYLGKRIVIGGLVGGVVTGALAFVRLIVWPPLPR